MTGGQRFTRGDPCPVCGGHNGLRQGHGVRCWGYLDGERRYARCTREEHAGRLPQNTDGIYSHRLGGDCACGKAHGQVPPPVLQRRPGTSSRSKHTRARASGGTSIAAEIPVAALAVLCAIDRGGVDLRVYPCAGCDRASLQASDIIRCPSCRAHSLTIERADRGSVPLKCLECPEHRIRMALDELGLSDVAVAWQEPVPPDWSKAKGIPMARLAG